MIAIGCIIYHVINLSGVVVGSPLHPRDWQPPTASDNITALHTTAPPWVSGPRTRGTFQILYSCMFTLGLCVYTAIHLNVPLSDDKSQVSYYLRKAKWVLVALFGPEVVLYSAWDQWRRARQFCNEFNGIAKAFNNRAQLSTLPKSREDNQLLDTSTPNSDKPGSVVAVNQSDAEDEPGTHSKEIQNTSTPNSDKPESIVAVIQSGPEAEPKTQSKEIQDTSTPNGDKPEPAEAAPQSDSEAEPKTQSKEIQHLELQDGFYAVMGGYVADLPAGWYEPVTLSGADKRYRPAGRYTLTPTGLIELAEKDIFVAIPTKTVQDKSKANVLAKFLVCFQVSFLVVQSIARKASGLPLTLLEVHTLVHVVCALFMYTLWFHKPLDIQDPTVVEPKKDVISGLALGQWGIPRVYSRAGNIIVYWEDQTYIQLFLGLLLLCAAYGGIHMAAWNFQFPTQVEHSLWKVACITAVCGSMVTPAWVLLVSRMDGTEPDISSEFQTAMSRLGDAWRLINSGKRIEYGFFIPTVFGVVMTPFFLVARVAIVIEAFLSMRAVPAGAYAEIPWTSYFPHV
ncbi:hypothetical protein K440DRAFT_631337 [Wilcoxina mikolae CBS 423.85]|nr:hypothetical protein K440DRAFT_631337 [Wilcoxina mikolae CBS 423.85]